MKQEKRFRVTWTIDIDGEPRNEKEAAQEALDIMRDPDSIATVFEVYKEGSSTAKVIDLNKVKVTCKQ